MKLIKSLLSLALGFQIAFASSLLTYGLPAWGEAAAPKPAAVTVPADDAAHARKVLSTIEASNTETYPTEVTDFSHLTNQTAWITQGDQIVQYDLSRPDVSIPSMMVPDFERDVTTEITPRGTLLFSYLKKGKVVARHEIPSVKAAHYGPR